MIIAFKIFYGILVALSVQTICNAELNPTICVNTSLGEMKGTQMESRSGDKFWAFRGVRYAQPPVGELRFQNPQPVKAWKPEVYDATKDGPICPQVTVNLTYLSEDCLRLNVYTKDTKARKPVIVYLHPGGFYAVAAISSYAGPENFMDRDIVLVTLNYRLGTLGFLATGTAEAAGNMGLKDQVVALRWIQQHIDKFGGDPNSVTLWGYSAGSLSIGLHMMSPMAKGLFHRGIMMSASPLGQFKYTSDQLDLAEKQAVLLNCPVKPIKDMVKCLKAKPMMDFVNTSSAMFEFGWNPVLNWKPVIENDCGGNQERYLIEDPYTTMAKGNISKVPLIIGTTEYEFYYIGYYTLRNETERRNFNENFAKYSPIYFLYERETPKSLEVSAALRSFYFQNKSLEYPQSLIPFGQLYGDGLIGFEYFRFLQMVSKYTPVYTYLFTYKGRYSHFVNPETNQTLGAMHHDELLYLLNAPLFTPQFKKTDPENDTIERLTRFWYEFAKKSDPNNASDEYLKAVKWPLYSEEKKQYLDIGQNLNVKSNGIFPERFQLWNRLFPINEMLVSNNAQCKI
ncbi:juvenile hormone esterase-like [Lucilia cuprina]|uniref:juvenile hormone esterase-like n=1 Tax=Lucilia cuprina TaxID=7375 RepID=UPI001F068909|nr:juvenile hormone esterase-like [Lucilia cuprina]